VSDLSLSYTHKKGKKRSSPSTPLLAVDTKEAHKQRCVHVYLTTGMVVQVRNLRERLEEEHQALLQREQDKAILEVRIARLTRIILHSTRIAKPSQAYGQRYRQLLLRESQARAPRKPPTPSHWDKTGRLTFFSKP